MPPTRLQRTLAWTAIGMSAVFGNLWAFCGINRWTSTAVNEKEAKIVARNGGIWPRTKMLRVGYLNVQAVRDRSPVEDVR